MPNADCCGMTEGCAFIVDLHVHESQCSTDAIALTLMNKQQTWWPLEVCSKKQASGL